MGYSDKNPVTTTAMTHTTHLYIH